MLIAIKCTDFPHCDHTCSGIIGTALDLQFTGRWFESWPGTTVQWSWASYLHLCASVTKQYNLVRAKGHDLFGWESNCGLVESNGSLPLGL